MFLQGVAHLQNTLFFRPLKVVSAWVTHFTSIAGISDGPLHAKVINKTVSFLKKNEFFIRV